MEGPAATSRLTAGPDGDVTAEASYGESDGDSEYVDLPKLFAHKLSQHAVT